MSRILWVATADARGHLMRCQLLARALAARGVDVDVVTTSDEGRAFLAAFDVRADLLSTHYRVEFDDRHNMARLRTEWRLVRYLTSPARLGRDLDWLVARARGADLVVDDSFHPALLSAHLLGGARALPPLLHIYGRTLRAALEHHFAGRLPPPLPALFRAGMASCVDAGFARIEHALDAPAGGRTLGPRTFVLPPPVAMPARARHEARAALGVRAGQRLAAVYLNPHFRDPALASAIEAALPAPAFALHAVGEGLAGRAGWRPCDPALADAIGAADLLVSGAGMATLEQARALGVPLVVLVTDQPEQEANLALLRASGHRFAAVPCAGPDLPARLARAVASLGDARRPSCRAAPVTGRWVELLIDLAAEARAIQHHEEMAA